MYNLRLLLFAKILAVLDSRANYVGAAATQSMLLKAKTEKAVDLLKSLENILPDHFQIVYDSHPVTGVKPTLDDLVRHLKASHFEFNELKPICLAQWLLESGRCSSVLFKEHNNAGGMKWRSEMSQVASPVEYEASDGKDTYCHFNSLPEWIQGYWRFIERSPYKGWRTSAEAGPRAYISFIASCGYAEDGNYVSKVLSLLPEAEGLLGASSFSKKKILLDPGHSERHVGARSRDMTVEEEDLNRMQARLIAELLAPKYDCEVFDPENDSLEEIGERAKGKQLFLSLHHNSYDGDRDPGTEIYITRGDVVSVALAEQILESICLSIGSINRGVKNKNYTVIAEASSFCEGPVMLIESYFLNPYDNAQATARSTKCAKAIAEVLLAQS